MIFGEIGRKMCSYNGNDFKIIKIAKTNKDDNSITAYNIDNTTNRIIPELKKYSKEDLMNGKYGAYSLLKPDKMIHMFLYQFMDKGALKKELMISVNKYQNTSRPKDAKIYFIIRPASTFTHEGQLYYSDTLNKKRIPNGDAIELETVFWYNDDNVKDLPYMLSRHKKLYNILLEELHYDKEHSKDNTIEFLRKFFEKIKLADVMDSFSKILRVNCIVSNENNKELENQLCNILNVNLKIRHSILYARDIDYNKIQYDFVLVRDNTEKVYLVTYEILNEEPILNSNFTNGTKIGFADQNEIFSKLLN